MNSESVNRKITLPRICNDFQFYFTLQDYFFKSSLGKNVIFLSDEDQVKIENAFVKKLPWRSFGRKNIGYLYAVANGAEYIWDFDDDNQLKFWLKNASPDPLLEIDQFIENVSGMKCRLQSRIQ